MTMTVLILVPKYEFRLLSYIFKAYRSQLIINKIKYKVLGRTINLNKFYCYT